MMSNMISSPDPVADTEHSQKDSITLHHAAADDIPALAAISGAAFQSDTHTQLKAQFHGAKAFEEGMAEGIREWLLSPKVDLLYAKDASTGEKVGWVAWTRRGFAGDKDVAYSDLPEEPESNPVRGSEASKTIGDLEAMTNASMMSWSRKLMPNGCQCRVIIAINVHPRYQSKGVGSKLIEWGTSKADQEPGTYCWVSSSMGGVRAFEKHGFQEVGRLEADLDEYSEGRGKPIGAGTEKWGVYSWIYLKRKSRA